MASESDSDTVRLGAGGTRIRVAVTLVVAALLLIGAIWGADDDFPFGPFRMYATADKLNSPVADTQVELVDVSGTATVLTPENTGIRRAEIEGQLSRFERDPALLRLLADAYAKRHPGQSLAGDTVQIIIRWYALSGGLPTGTYTEQIVTRWAVTSG